MDSEDFYDLLNLSGEEGNSQIGNHCSSPSNQPPMALTFMKPNINTLKEYPINKLHEKYRKSLDPPSLFYSNIYLLEIQEQPIQCRVSGDIVKDRRPIDPAPVIKLTIFDSNLKQIKESIDSPFYIMHTSLWSADMKTKFEVMNNTKVMLGSLVSSASLLKNLDSEEGYYFAFPDLSIRFAGQYRLQFSLIHLIRNEVVSDTFSDSFCVYPAKVYPGMKGKTIL
ncbi:velvet factor-domain-containing protein [Sporodiniella umbellata]|nr:velvet factor-domain-containing protein [Sporodiniella umbellata]